MSESFPNMEIYQAVSDFTPPVLEDGAESTQTILSFKKGDKFEVFDCKHSDWWGARRLSDNNIGYVPSKYMQVRNAQTLQA